MPKIALPTHNPLMSYSLRKPQGHDKQHCHVFQVFVKAMMLFSAAAAILASLRLDSYTAETPKRLFIQHMIRDSNTDMPYAVFAAASSDATPIGVALTGMNLTEAEMNGREWLVSFFCLCCLCADRAHCHLHY